MKKGYLSLIACHLLLVSSVKVMAAQNTVNPWVGPYVGTKIGVASSQFSNKTTTQPGPLFNQESTHLVNQFGQQTINETGFLSGITAGYNGLVNNILLGLETDIQSLSISGSTFSGAVLYPNDPDSQFVITSYGNHNWLLTLRPRIGVVAQNWLFYATGGLALGQIQSDFLFSTDAGEFESQRVRKFKPGFVLGAGFEAFITKQLSMKAEYLFEQFKRINAVGMNHNLSPQQTFSNQVDLKSTLVSLGLNYHFNDALPGKAYLTKWLSTNPWIFDIGWRVLFSSGSAGAPQPLLNTSTDGNRLASRLIFSDLSAISQEVFARLEHEKGLFVKGLLGAGSVTNGQLNDEDFPAFAAYSNTLSDVTGNLSYATIDLGYSLLKSVSGQIGAFIGYSYFAQNLNAYGCRQLAGDVVCVPSTELNGFLGISEDEAYHALRLGLASAFQLADRWVIESEAAYMPAIRYRGTDLHNARQLVGPEASNNGDGAMLEGIVNYQVNPNLRFGVGGRYWMWNMHNGSVGFDFLGDPDDLTEPGRFNSTRYGVFLQVQYRQQPLKLDKLKSAPMQWSGLFLGGQLGGAWSKARWSNPFGSTPGLPGYINVAGFGDRIRTTGPLGGLSLQYNRQTNTWVYGLELNGNIADIRGENTLFSGIGGLNGQMVSSALASINGRIGKALERSLVYINTGPAVLHTKYNLNGFTSILNLGRSYTSENQWGWSVGAGFEHALTDLWTTRVEYDYIHLANDTIGTPSLALVNEERISVRQNMNVFKLGVHCKIHA